MTLRTQALAPHFAVAAQMDASLVADAVALDGGGVDERTGKALDDVRDALGRLDVDCRSRR